MKSKKENQRPHFGFGDPKTTIAERLASGVDSEEDRRQWAQYHNRVDAAKAEHCGHCTFSLFCLAERFSDNAMICSQCLVAMFPETRMLVGCTAVIEAVLQRTKGEYGWAAACPLCAPSNGNFTHIRGFFVPTPLRRTARRIEGLQRMEAEYAGRQKTRLP